jgi:hypothetical protein
VPSSTALVFGEGGEGYVALAAKVQFLVTRIDLDIIAELPTCAVGIHLLFLVPLLVLFSSLLRAHPSQPILKEARDPLLAVHETR